VDAFLYAGERDLLESRVATLAPLDVLHLAIVADRTHQGEVTPSEAWIEECGDLPVMVAFVSLAAYDGTPGGGAGMPGYQVRERAHRLGASTRACRLAGDDGLVALSDVDEIPRPEVLGAIERGDVADGRVLCLAMRMHPWSAAWLYPGPWLGTTIATHNTVASEGLQWMRDARGTDLCRTIGDVSDKVHVDAPQPAAPYGGWHLSWWGDDARRRWKLHAFSHGELAYRHDDLGDLAVSGMDINGLALLHVDPSEYDWPEGITP